MVSARFSEHEDIVPENVVGVVMQAYQLIPQLQSHPI
jgi:hypothetical protein